MLSSTADMLPREEPRLLSARGGGPLGAGEGPGEWRDRRKEATPCRWTDRGSGGSCA